MADRPASLVIYHAATAKECRERALVLRSVGIRHAVRRGRDGWNLIVPEPLAAKAAGHLEAYAQESTGWAPPRPPLPMPYRFGYDGIVAYTAVLLLVELAVNQRALGEDWLAAGRLHAGLVRDGQWWRTVTALTLHTDATHLAGNLIIGAAFVLFAGRFLGNGLTWMSVVIAGAVGNTVSALLQPPTHLAIGASTAVFATLGLVTAYGWRRRDVIQLAWPLRFAPLVIGVFMFAWMGSGGERTDVMSHLTGFLAGLALGAYYGGFENGIVLGRRWQWGLGLGAVAIVAISWAIALGAHG